jgi:hypothetical protein
MLSDPEIPKSLNDRRSFIKMMAAAPLFFTIASRSLADTVAAAKAKTLGANVYSRLGVRPFINGRGTWTYLSGSLELATNLGCPISRSFFARCGIPQI